MVITKYIIICFLNGLLPKLFSIDFVLSQFREGWERAVIKYIIVVK